MNVRIKVYCISVTKQMGMANNPETGKYEPCVTFDYKFNVVSSGSEENKKFFAATPTGSILFSAIRDDLFEIGKEYYSDLTPAS